MRLRERVRAIRAWLRPPRRLRLQTGGAVIITGVFALGFATLNTGNNLLYLLVGSLLGIIALSGWLSEQAVSGIRLERRVPAAATAGQRARLEYRVHNRKRRLASVSLELSDRVLRRGDRTVRVAGEPAWVPMLAAGATQVAGGWITAPARGIYALEQVTVATAYPFGLFIKERDVALPGTLVVWPRTDRVVRPVQAGAGRGSRPLPGAGVVAGAERGDFRGLRGYRPGDDPRDVHWRTSARTPEPVVREYDRERSDAYWLVLDLQSGSGEGENEAAVEIAAALAARAAARADRFGFAAGSTRIPPASTGGQLEAVLDALAAAEFHPNAPLALPAAPAECVLISALTAPSGGFADVLLAGAEARA